MPIIGSFGAGSKGGYGRGGAKKYDIDFLVIAGGGAGATSNYAFISGGGGGAGGYRTSTQEVIGGTEITITVGDGSSSQTVNGSPSSFSGTDLTTIESAGGGGSAQYNEDGLGGGSGGGNPGRNGGAGGSGTVIIRYKFQN